MGSFQTLENKKNFYCQCCSEIDSKMGFFLNDLSKIIKPIDQSTKNGNHHQLVN